MIRSFASHVRSPRPRRRLVAAGCGLVLLASITAPADAEVRHSICILGPVDDDVVPSPLVVSGLAGVVTKVTVTLHGVDASAPNDLDVMSSGRTGSAWRS